MILSDKTLRYLCNEPLEEELYNIPPHARLLHPYAKPMIEPFIDHQIRENEKAQPIVSYGLSAGGYDIRLCSTFRTFSKPNDGRVIDIKNQTHPDHCDYVSETIEADTLTIPPGGLVIGRTQEYFRMPSRVMGICTGKSTWARSGLQVNVTPLEPGWEGYLVVELTNGTNLPLKIYAHEGIAQIIFHVIDFHPQKTYEGKYQGQQDLVGSRMR